VDTILLQTGEPEEIATRCIELFSDPQRAAEIGQAGRLMAERYFDARVQAHLLEDTYRAALNVFDSVIARDVWNASAEVGPVALRLSRKLKLLAERKGPGAEADMLKEHSRYMELMQHRVAGLETSLAQRDQEIATLAQPRSEALRIQSSPEELATGHLEVALNRLKTRMRRLLS
jgi:hypothetical protein